MHRALAGHVVATAYEQGWAEFTNGELLAADIVSLRPGELQEWSLPD